MRIESIETITSAMTDDTTERAGPSEPYFRDTAFDQTLLEMHTSPHTLYILHQLLVPSRKQTDIEPHSNSAYPTAEIYRQRVVISTV